MKLGCCADIQKAEIVQRAGFDFIECTVTSLSPEKDDHYFREILLKPFEASPIPVEACNVFLPGDLTLVGDSVNWERIHSYVERALERVKRIGAEIVVFGSGKARSIPAGFDREKGETQILNFLNKVADKAEETGITVVIEPLNKKESNVINTIPEAVDFAQKVSRSSIQVLADFYHMDEEDENLDHIVQWGDYLRHIHVADTGRMAPGTGNYPYEVFVDKIKQANYQGRISIECKWNDFDSEVKEAKRSLEQIFSN
ncbi:sugar phosphate isomerase/epimerase [Pullulanibacillus pueri]|uniref:Xylose isomerase n=1 Tax=Pullulanibacillus pueri TaxID=1437324 RepID=A0A8J2ZXZ6_9BACL|nr:sugar phosphate isomerase/epimerase family protein [Pullulanibacillus pueri]MBM7682986.1 sugar phosphate isomerase/epimerase [Pullulanibacillus pueri]GGH85949.1 xylose isomerase [Pullulanibacillus pueri]